MIYVILTVEVILIVLLSMLPTAGVMFICMFFKEWNENWQTKKWNEKWEKEFEERIQRKRRRELHRKEMEKYPLFYWKELTNGDG